MRFSREK
ncbi:unnamed protein product [Callosobruchus maculatus]|nr:unnamed protein product [Callosobruchus maculatus]